VGNEPATESSAAGKAVPPHSKMTPIAYLPCPSNRNAIVRYAPFALYLVQVNRAPCLTIERSSAGTSRYQTVVLDVEPSGWVISATNTLENRWVTTPRT